MLETQFYGKILPSHPDIKPILLDVQEKYGIPPISADDDGLKVLLEHHLGINWNAVHSEILERLKDVPDLIPEKTRNGYLAFKRFQKKGLVDPELKKMSSEFRKNINLLVDSFIRIYEPTFESIDGFYLTLTDLCVEFLLTGEARPIPEDWLSFVKTLTDSNGEKTILVMANQMANPDVIAEQFKAEYEKAFGENRPKITEKHLKTADYLRMKWFGNSTNYLLEEDEIINPQKYRGRKSRRYPTAARRHHSRMRQDLHRLREDLFKIFK